MNTRSTAVLISICAVAAIGLATSPASLAFSGSQSMAGSSARTGIVSIGSLTAKAPDLIITLTNPMSGKIVVRNVGSATSGPSDLTIECTAVAKARSCAESSKMAPYENPAYPNKAWIAVPGLKPGKHWVHKLKFWNSLSWPSGTFSFVAEIDAGHAVAETNEANNGASSTLVVP
jgi:hypothetical protein